MRAASARWLFDRAGRAIGYVSNSGTLHDGTNRPVALLDGPQVLRPTGAHLGWFDGLFLRDEAGDVLAFTEAARGRSALELPQAAAVTVRARPLPLLARPVAAPRERPPFRERWSERDAARVLVDAGAQHG